MLQHCSTFAGLYVWVGDAVTLLLLYSLLLLLLLLLLIDEAEGIGQLAEQNTAATTSSYVEARQRQLRVLGLAQHTQRCAGNV